MFESRFCKVSQKRTDRVVDFGIFGSDQRV